MCCFSILKFSEKFRRIMSVINILGKGFPIVNWIIWSYWQHWSRHVCLCMCGGGRGEGGSMCKNWSVFVNDIALFDTKIICTIIDVISVLEFNHHYHYHHHHIIITSPPSSLSLSSLLSPSSFSSSPPHSPSPSS